MRKFSILLVFVYVTIFSIYNFAIAANPASPIVPGDNIQDPGDPLTAWGGCGPLDSNCYVTVSSEISGLDAATAINTINNAAYLQEWQWNTLAGGSALKLSSTSTLATGDTQKLFEVSLSGANTTDVQTTYAGHFSNTHTGVDSTNVGLYATASGGTNNYAIWSNGTFILEGTGGGIGFSNGGSGSLFIGTVGESVSQSFFFGQEAGESATSANNSNFFGENSGQSATNANHSNFFGSSAGVGAVESNHSNFFGDQAGFQAEGSDNSNFFGYLTGFETADTSDSNFFGYQAGYDADNATHSNFFGYRSGYQATNAANSHFFGNLAGYQASGAVNSIFIGQESGELATSAMNAVFLGFQTGETASAADYSVFIGDQAGEDATNANEAVYIGRHAGQFATNAENSIFLGEDAGQGAINASESIFLGTTAGDGDNVANDNTKYSILIGPATSTGGFSSSIAMGRGATNTASNQLVIGSSTGGALNSISSIFFGSGVTATAPVDYTINGTGGSGTDIGGGDVTIAGGRATGNASGGSILFQTSDAGASGITLRNLSTKMTILGSGFVGISNTAPAVALHIGSASTTDATTLLRLEDANSTCNFTADAGAPTCGSDRRLKTDIEDLDTGDILEKLVSLDTVSYHWKTDDEDAELQYGFIAQNVQDYFPNLVKEGEWIDGSQKLFLSMGGLMPYAVASIKELDLKLNDIQDFEDEGSNFGGKLREWFGSSTNGIRSLFVKDTICIGETCINEDQLKALIQNVGVNTGNSNTEDEIIEENEVVEEQTEDVIIEELEELPVEADEVVTEEDVDLPVETGENTETGVEPEIIN
jgi:hypothetical protein